TSPLHRYALQRQVLEKIGRVGGGWRWKFHGEFWVRWGIVVADLASYELYTELRSILSALA
ncbi:MAG: hypothetical protein U1D28_00900, partial [Burkholderiales bacterium]|nr:hypothetical protein [Burkholderiales bacterium]